MRHDSAAGPDVGDVGSRSVAIFGSFRYGQYFEDLLAGVVAGAEAADSSVISIQTSEGVLPSAFEDLGQDAVSRAAWDHVDGAIVVLKAVSPSFVARLRAAGKFVVAIGQDRRGAHTAITIDNAGGIRDAVTHLHGHGHARIGFLSPTWQADSVERYAAYQDCMTQLGLPVLPLLGGDEMRREHSRDQQGYLAGRRFAAVERPCTAVIIGCDPEALGFIRGIREMGLRIPDDLAVIGIDDVDEAAVSSPPLATIAISFRRVGQTAFEVALRGGRGESMETGYSVAERLVPRESCGCSNTSKAGQADGPRSQVDTLAQALVDASDDGAVGRAADPDVVTALAGDVVQALSRRPDDAGDQDVVMRELASRIIELCPLDRSVQAATRAIRAVADTQAGLLARRDPGPLWELSEAALDLCDAIRSAQLQRRMSEYVGLKRMQFGHYFIGNSLLSHDRDELRSLGWLEQTPADAGALGLWSPPGQTDRLIVRGGYQRHVEPPASTASGPSPAACGVAPGSRSTSVPVESFPPRWLLRDAGSDGRLIVITQVRFEDADWGLLAVAGGPILQSSLVQETFQQWSILMSTSLSAEKADADLARQADELTAAYEKELALIEEVRVSEERYALAAEAAQDALWDWDIASDTVFYSTQWKAMLGYRDQEVGGNPREWLDRIHPDDVDAVGRQLNGMLTADQPYLNFEHRLKTAAGDYRWIACSGRCVVDGDGRPVRIVGSVSDVTVRRLMQDQLMQEARFDALTGLAKGTLFRELLCDALEIARRDPNRSFAVLFMDLNGFKDVNDSLGHAAGDQLLSSVAKRLSATLRRGDTAARLGGDEFAVLLSAVNHLDEVPPIVERIEALVREPHHIGGTSVTVGAAIGVAVSSRGYESAEAMLHDADSAMYRAKRLQRAHRSTALDRR